MRLRRRKTLDYLTLVARNLGRAGHGGPDRPAVRATLMDDIEEFHPDTFVLTEAATYRSVLDLPGYRLLQEKPDNLRDRSDDTGDVAILLRDDHPLKRRWVARMTRWWTVLSHRQRHEPHAYENAVAKVRGRVWRIRGTHPPTHGFHGPNRKAFTETAVRSRRWFKAAAGRPSVDAGDWNETKERLQAWFGRGFEVFGRRIDVAVTRNVESCVWRELPKAGSDHYGRYYRFEA